MTVPLGGCWVPPMPILERLYSNVYLLPTEFLPNLLMLSSEQSIVKKRAQVIPMSSRSVQIPCLDVTTAPTAGETAFFGGLTANWSEEAATLTEEEPTFKNIELVAHELTGYTLA